MPIENAQSLAGLLIDPRETLSTELKAWLDMTADEHRAILAKAIIALANHGGGAIIIGFQAAQEGEVQPAPNRPADLGSYTPDEVNAIVRNYIEPAFHCDVRIEAAPNGDRYPILVVPGGHRTPIRSRRASADGRTVRENVFYTRLPGPRSEQPRTGAEWDELMQRCLQNGRENLLDRFRAIMDAQPIEPGAAAVDELEEWHNSSIERWRDVTRELAAEHTARFPLGYFSFSYILRGDLRELNLNELRTAVERAKVRHTGWPFFVSLGGHMSYPREPGIECWVATADQPDRAPALSDFWRVSRDAKAFSIRGYQEDSGEVPLDPGVGFDVSLPIWRAAEALLNAAGLAEQFGNARAEVSLKVAWTGLNGRHLYARRMPFLRDYVCREDSYEATITVRADQISETLPELTRRLVTPMLEKFSFFEVPEEMVANELRNMRRDRF